MNPQSHTWVELARSFAGNNAGQQVKLASLEEKNRLIADGIARECDDPEDSLVKSAVEKVVAVTLEAVDRKLDSIAKSSTYSPAFAIPRDHHREKMNGFASSGEFWSAVASAGTPGRATDPRLHTKAPSGLNTRDGSDGGFLVPQAVSDDIMSIVYDEAGLLGRTDTQAISGNSITLKAVDETSRATGSRHGGVRGYWLAEAEQYTSSKPKFREVSLKPHKLGVFYYATDEELSDTTGVSLEKKLARYAAEEITWLVNEAIIAGDGVGKPLGILNSDCLVTVSEEGGQASSSIVFPNIVNMYTRMLPNSLQNAVWLVNAECIPQLISMAFPDSLGTAPALLAGNAFPSAAKTPFGTMLGRPIIVTEHNDALGAVGDILFVDLSMYKTVTRGSIDSAMSIHVRFDYGETAFRFDFRVDGQPWLTSAITPAKGSNTLSPFIALAAR